MPAHEHSGHRHTRQHAIDDESDAGGNDGPQHAGCSNDGAGKVCVIAVLGHLSDEDGAEDSRHCVGGARIAESTIARITQQ